MQSPEQAAVSEGWARLRLRSVRVRPDPEGFWYGADDLWSDYTAN